MAEYCYHCMASLRSGRFCVHCGTEIGSVCAKAYQLQPGTILQNRYLLGRVLGSGGFGITYIGRDLKLKRKVAVKEFYPSSCAQRDSKQSAMVTLRDDGSYFSTRGKASFIREAQTLALLPRMDGVVEAYDFFEENGTAYIVIEYLDGKTLKQLLEERCFSSEEIFQLFEPVIDSLAKIHQQGLVHRDISPDNLMLCKNGNLVLMDFGAARHVHNGSMTIMVKRGFAPTEQYRSNGSGPWSDVYALCATIYECITGLVPEESNERTKKDALRFPSELGIAITPVQEAALRRGLALRVENRFLSMEELKNALKESKPKRREPNRVESHIPLSAGHTTNNSDRADWAQDKQNPGRSDADHIEYPISQQNNRKRSRPEEKRQSVLTAEDGPEQHNYESLLPPDAGKRKMERTIAIILTAFGVPLVGVMIALAVVLQVIWLLTLLAVLMISDVSVLLILLLQKYRTWSLGEDGMLLIYGVGKMPGWDIGITPWEKQKKRIRTVVVDEGATTIGDYACCGCINLTSVNLPGTLEIVGTAAFYNCPNLTDVYYAGSEQEWALVKKDSYFPSVNMHYYA